MITRPSLRGAGFCVIALTQSTLFAQQSSSIVEPPSRNPSFQTTSSTTSTPRPEPRQAESFQGGNGQFQRLSQLMNSEVLLQGGDPAGKISDFVVGPRGTIDFAIAADGDQFYSIPFNSLNVNAQNRVQLNLTAEQYQQLPFFAANRWPNFNQAAVRNQMTAMFPQNPNAAGNAANPGLATDATSPYGDATLHPYGNDALPGGNPPTNMSQPGTASLQNRANAENAAPNAGNAAGNIGTNRTPANGTRPRIPGSITGTPESPARAANRQTGGGVATGANNATGQGLVPRPGQSRFNPGTGPIQPVPSVGGTPGGAPVNSQPNNRGAATGGPAIGSPRSNTSGTGAATGGPGLGQGTGPAAGGPPVGTGNNSATGGPGVGQGPATGGPAIGNPGNNTSGTGPATGGPSINTPNSAPGGGTPGTGSTPR